MFAASSTFETGLACASEEPNSTGVSLAASYDDAAAVAVVAAAAVAVVAAAAAAAAAAACSGAAGVASTTSVLPLPMAAKTLPALLFAGFCRLNDVTFMPDV